MHTTRPSHVYALHSVNCSDSWKFCCLQIQWPLGWGGCVADWFHIKSSQKMRSVLQYLLLHIMHSLLLILQLCKFCGKAKDSSNHWQWQSPVSRQIRLFFQFIMHTDMTSTKTTKTGLVITIWSKTSMFYMLQFPKNRCNAWQLGLYVALGEVITQSWQIQGQSSSSFFRHLFDLRPKSAHFSFFQDS